MAYKKFSTTKATALAAAASASATMIELVDGSSYPDPAVGGNGPYTLLLAYGSDREEIVTVTAKPSANTLTVTRGQDGSAATTKNIGDIVVHGVSKRDWEDLQTEIDALNSDVGTLNSEMSTKAPLASPTLTGDPKAPTPAAGDNDTSIATTAFVQQQVPIGTIAMWGGTAAPTGWHLCDGSAHGSTALQAVLSSANAPDLRGRFVVGAGGTYARGNTGGADTVALTTANMPSHSHGGNTGAMSANAIHAHGIVAGGGHQHTYYVSNPTNDNYGLADSPFHRGNVNIGMTAATTVGADGGHGHSMDNASTAHTHGITAEGSGTAHENRPPYYALVYIIKKA